MFNPFIHGRHTPVFVVGNAINPHGSLKMWPALSIVKNYA